MKLYLFLLIVFLSNFYNLHLVFCNFFQCKNCQDFLRSILEHSFKLITCFSHLEGITLGAVKEIYVVGGRASGMCLNEIDEISYSAGKDKLLGCIEQVL